MLNKNNINHERKPANANDRKVIPNPKRHNDSPNNNDVVINDIRCIPRLDIPPFLK